MPSAMMTERNIGMNICRCCGSYIDTAPILRFDDMPKAAQAFPTREELKEESGVTLSIFQCPYCGLIQILGEPVSYYKDVIRAAAVSQEMRAFRLGYFREFVEKYGLNGKRMVEIGSGRGEFLKLMNEAGVIGYGLEHMASSVEASLKRGLSVFQGYIEGQETKLEGAPFDGFFIMNFLEHSPEPNLFLKGIWNNLVNGAIGLIEVPNVDMILKEAMFSEFISDHLLYFTSDTLKLMLEKNGFDVLECRPVWHDYCLAAVVRKKILPDMSQFYGTLYRVSRELNQYIDGCHRKNRAVAVWGAGHQALAVIALSKIKDKIAFVVDSAAFKQGKYTPGTHLEIVAPDRLNEGTVGAIIVMAASYSDEVAQIIKREHTNLDIAILRQYGLELVYSEKGSHHNED